MQPTALQNPQDILNAIQTLAGNYASNIPTPSIPSLNYTAPSASDLSTQYQQFLTRAANDPDIINYYNNLLNQAQGDTNLALNFLQQDYQTGVRQTQANLAGTLAQEQVQSTQEQNNLQDTLNKRGIGLTQGANGKLDYAGGGQSATELGQLNQSQQLRQEAEQRSASQNVENMGINLQKGVTSQGQGLQQYATNLSQQKQGDIANRANTYYGLYQGQQASNLTQAEMKQQDPSLTFPTIPAQSSPASNQFLPGTYTQNQLPSQLFNTTSGSTINYNGTNYNVKDTGQGTRQLAYA